MCYLVVQKLVISWKYTNLVGKKMLNLFIYFCNLIQKCIQNFGNQIQNKALVPTQWTVLFMHVHDDFYLAFR